MKRILYILLGSLFFNCGGLKSYKNENAERIIDVMLIEGVYKNFSQDSINLYHKTFNGKLNWRKKYRDTTSFESFKISVINQKQLKIDFYKQNALSKSRVLRYRLRNNGFIKLRNQNFRISGIPYLFGEYDLMKYELGLTKENDLILNGYNEQAGGLLIVLSSGRAYSINQIYARIE